MGYHVPRALDLAGEDGREVGQRTAAAGLMALPRMAEIYPVGGAPVFVCASSESNETCMHPTAAISTHAALVLLTAQPSHGHEIRG